MATIYDRFICLQENTEICSNLGEKGPKDMFMARNLGLACALETVFSGYIASQKATMSVFRQRLNLQ